MKDRRINGFFYGLFMDPDILAKYGIGIEGSIQAYVEDFRLLIGDRATLVPCEGARAYGMLIALTHADLDKLYKAPGLQAYRPEAMLVQSMNGEMMAAICYNLLHPPGESESNREYAIQLRDVLSKLGFPDKYIASVT